MILCDSVVVVCFFRVRSLLLFAQCDELACAAHWALNRHREHRINCDCLYTYINNLHTDGNACLCFVFSSVPLFFVRVCALSFDSVCDSMYKMDCDVDTGNSFPCQHSMVFPFVLLFSIHSFAQPEASIPHKWLNVHFIFHWNSSSSLTTFKKVLKLFWSTNQFYSCYMRFRSVSRASRFHLFTYLWGKEIHSPAHKQSRHFTQTIISQLQLDAFYHCVFFFSLPPLYRRHEFPFTILFIALRWVFVI